MRGAMRVKREREREYSKNNVMEFQVYTSVGPF